MSSGYSKTPLERKLGLKANFKIYLFNIPVYYNNLFGQLPEGIEYQKLIQKDKLDFIHAFFTSNNALTQTIKSLKNGLKKMEYFG